MACTMVREIWVQRDVDAVLVVERRRSGCRCRRRCGSSGPAAPPRARPAGCPCCGRRRARPRPTTPANGIASPATSDAHDDGDGGHHAEVGQDAGGGKSLVGGHGHASHVTRAVPTRPIHGIGVPSHFGLRERGRSSLFPGAPDSLPYGCGNHPGRRWGRPNPGRMGTQVMWIEDWAPSAACRQATAGRTLRAGCRAEQGQAGVPGLPGADRVPRRGAGQPDRVGRVGRHDRA